MSKDRIKYNIIDQSIILFILEVILLSLSVGLYFYLNSSESSIEYEHPEWIPVLFASSLMSLGFMAHIYQKNRRLKKLSEPRLMPYLTGEISSSRSLIKFILIRLSILFVILAIIDPKIGTKLSVVKTEGQDIMICLDVSNSMLAEDIQPNRLNRAKMALGQFFKKVSGHRVGVIVFAGDAYVQLPLTTDYEAAKLFLDGVDTEMISKQGTAIGTAIDLAIESFDWDQSGNKSIVIITDGENHEDNSITAAREAAEKNVIIHAIGMGTTQGGPIPIINSRGSKTGFKKDKSGNTVVSILDENKLKKLVAEANGIFIRAQNNNVGLDLLMEEIELVEKEEIDTFKYSEYQHSFQFSLIIAIFFFLLEFLISEKRRQWSKNLSLLN